MSAAEANSVTATVGCSESASAMPPRNVCAPVQTPIAAPEPLSTLAPGYAMLDSSIGFAAAAFFSVSNFSTGKLSPVSEPWMRKRSLAAREA
ncbi:MAG: hypothetical protein U0572_13055 [Phycisphaerales bacterium]